MAEGGARRILRMLGIAVLIVTAAVAIGLGLYRISDASLSPDTHEVGDSSAADRITLYATVEKVDPAQYTATVRVLAVPRGQYTSDDGDSANRKVQVLSSGLRGGSTVLEPGRRIAVQSIPVELQRGEITNYPFDHYLADLYFSAVIDGKNVPLEVILENNDDFYLIRATLDADDVEPGLRLHVSRSVGTYIMVAIMFVAMWALALAVAAAAVVIGRNRLGLVWPAMAWMAATLFALAAFRGTAPGNPPIGSILDFTAFLWAEAIVVCSLTYIVVRGVPLEWKKDTG